MRQEHVDGWLAGGPPGRQRIRGFLAWATERGLAAEVSAPARTVGQPSQFADQNEQMRQLARCLGEDTMPIELRVIGAMLLLFGITPARVLRISQEQIAEHDGDTYLTLDQHPLLIPPRLAVLFRQLPKPTAGTTLPPNPREPRLLFPGRATGHPVSAGGIRSRLAHQGITIRAARNTALISLAADLPAPVLADLLGLHIATGVRWAKCAKRDWETYLADRRRTTRQTPRSSPTG